jgi:predicted anti-sigma-YlaC factor YlaD
MKGCEKFEEGIQSLIAGNPQLRQLEELVEHCKSCRECRELFEMHRTLADLGSRFDALESVDLSAARRSIVEKVEAQNRRRLKSGRMAAFWTPFTLRPLAAALLIVVVFALGLVASRLGSRPPSPSTEMTDKAFLNANLKNMPNTPYSFSNVAVRYLDSSTVSISFDVIRRVAIVEPEHSELVKGILLNSQFNPSSTGAVGHFQNTPSKDKLFY